VPIADPKQRTGTCESVDSSTDERFLQLDLVRLDRVVAVAGCAGGRYWPYATTRNGHPIARARQGPRARTTAQWCGAKSTGFVVIYLSKTALSGFWVGALPGEAGREHPDHRDLGHRSRVLRAAGLCSHLPVGRLRQGTPVTRSPGSNSSRAGNRTAPAVRR